MAKGDQDDIYLRITSVLPPWFPSTVVFLKSWLQGTANNLASVYAFMQKAASQSRIRTQTGGFLDLTGWDFFGGRFVRRAGEPDPSWQSRILPEILRPRQTRAAMVRMLTDLTGTAPVITELYNPYDMGGYDVPTMGGYDVGSTRYADLKPNQFLIDSYRTPSQGVPIAGGFDTYNAAYDIGTTEYIDMAWVSGLLTDAEIYQRVQETVAAGVSAYVALHNPGGPVTGVTGSSSSPGSMDFTDSNDSDYVAVI